MKKALSFLGVQPHHCTKVVVKSNLEQLLSKKGKDMKRSDKSMQQLYEIRQRDRSNMRDRDLEHITEMLLMMGLQRHLARRGNGNNDDDDEDSEDEDDVFLSDVIAALLADEDLGSMLGPYR